MLLLILLSTAFVLSRMNLLKQIQGLLVVPLMIGAGVLFGPRGLFTLDESLISSLDGTMRMVLSWLGFLAGLRSVAGDTQYRWTRQGLFRFLHIISTTLVIYWASHTLFPVTDVWGVFPTLASCLVLAALFVTSSYFSSAARLQLENSLAYLSYADSIFITLSFFGAVLLFRSEGAEVFALLHLMIPMLVSLVAILLLGKKTTLQTPDRLALGGLVALAGGWAVGISVLEVITGFLLGSLLSVVKLVPRFDERLLSTEVPLRMVVYFYAGLVVTLSWDAFFVALVLTLIRFLFKWWLVQRHAGRTERLSSVYRFSTLSIPLLLSLEISPIPTPMAPFLLAIMCFAYLINDILLLIELSLFHAAGSDKGDAMESTGAQA